MIVAIGKKGRDGSVQAWYDEELGDVELIVEDEDDGEQSVVYLKRKHVRGVISMLQRCLKRLDDGKSI